MTRLVLALLSVLLLAPGVQAQCSSSYHARSYSRSYSYYSPSYSYYTPKYKEEKKVEAVYTNFLLAFPVVALPSYGAAYQEPVPLAPSQRPQSPFTPPNGTGTSQQPGPSAAPQPSPFEQQVLGQLKSLNDGLLKLNERVERLERTRAPIPLKEPKEKGPPKEKDGDIKSSPEFIAANIASCAACHQKGKDENGEDIPSFYGGGFIFTNEAGNLNPALTANDRESIQVQLTRGKMPKVSTPRARKMGVKPLSKDAADAIFKEIDRQINASRKEADAQ